MIPAMTSIIDTTRSPLQALISSTGGQVVAIICKRRDASGQPNEDSYFGSSISLSLVTERKSRFEGDESTSYADPNDANYRYSFFDSDTFWTGSEALNLAACSMFWDWSLDSA